MLHLGCEKRCTWKPLCLQCSRVCFSGYVRVSSLGVDSKEGDVATSYTAETSQGAERHLRHN